MSERTAGGWQLRLKKNGISKLGMVVHAYNPSTWEEADAGGKELQKCDSPGFKTRYKKTTLCS